MSTENVALVSQWLDAYNGRDSRFVAALLDPEVKWRSIGAPVSGAEAIRGRDAVVRFLFEDVLGAMPDFRVAIEEIRDLPGDQVLLIAQYEGHGGASGAAFSHDSAAIFRFRAGVITFFQDFAVRDQALKAVDLEE